MTETDWAAWHEGYADSSTVLADRLGVVQRFVREFLDSRTAGEQEVLSLCAGKGFDLLGVLSGHPRAESVKARLVEIDPDLAAAARQLAARAGLSGVEVAVGDASCTDAFVGAVPADLVLVCGVFGNVSDGDVEAVVRAMPELCAEDGVVIWTRHTWPPDLNPRIRGWFAEAGFSERGFSSPGARSYAVGMNQLLARPQPFIANKRLFTFIDPLSRPASRATLP